MISYKDALTKCEEMIIAPGTKSEQLLCFVNARIDRKTVPDGVYVYDIRGGDRYDFCTIEPVVYVNHTGSVIADRPIRLNKRGTYSLYRNPHGWTFM